MASDWRPIKTFRGPDYREVDLWLEVPARPSTMGWGDSWREVNCYRKNGEWFDRNHDGGKEQQIVREYVTHWMPVPKAPSRRNKS